MTVYLAGPINGCSDDEANTWRERATEVLTRMGAEVLDPMRRDYRGRENDPGIAKKIVTLDLEDIDACDVLLVMSPKPSTGTSMEVWEATQHMGKPAVLIAPLDVSPWMRFCATEHVETLDEALNLLTQ